VSSREAVDGTKKREESNREKLINKETREGEKQTNVEMEEKGCKRNKTLRNQGGNIRKRHLPRSNVGGGRIGLQKSIGYVIIQCSVDIYLCISS